MFGGKILHARTCFDRFGVMEQYSTVLRILKITENLERGHYLATDVFSNEEVAVQLTGKQRMHFELPVDAEVYAVSGVNAMGRARYLYTWRDAMRLDNTPTALDAQRKALDERYVQQFGQERFDHIRVYGESKKFEH